MSPGGKLYRSVGSEAEGAAGEDLQISFTTQLMKILFLQQVALWASTGLYSWGVCVPCYGRPPASVRNTCSHITLGPDLEHRCACLAAQNIGGGIAGVSLASHVHQHFAVQRANAKEGWTVIAQVPRNTHTAYARTHKHRRARSNAARADMTFHFSIKDSAFSLSLSPLPARWGSLGSAHNAQSTNKHTHPQPCSHIFTFRLVCCTRTHTRSPLWHSA